MAALFMAGYIPAYSLGAGLYGGDLFYRKEERLQKHQQIYKKRKNQCFDPGDPLPAADHYRYRRHYPRIFTATEDL